MIVECEQLKDVWYDQDGIIVRRATMHDVAILTGTMRESDRQEVWASHHHSPNEALRLSIEKSLFSLTVEKDMEPIVMFGIGADNVLGDKAYIWMLSSPEIDKIARRLVKHSREFVDLFLEYYPYLENWVDCRNTKSIAWLKMIGAKFDEPMNAGAENKPFVHFVFERK